jgi:VanZ family protein
MPRVDATPALRALCLAGAIGMAAQVLFLVEPPVAQVVLAHVWDKCVHFLYFGAMAAFLYMAAGGRRPVAAWLLVVVIGALDETQQLFVPGRDADVLDWLADALGAAAFISALRIGGIPCAES